MTYVEPDHADVPTIWPRTTSVRPEYVTDPDGREFVRFLTGWEETGRTREHPVRPPECDAAVTRDGELGPCGKPAVAWTSSTTDDVGPIPPWPVCAWHANRLGALPLPGPRA